MDKDSYRFIVRCLGWSVVLLVIASISFGPMGLNPSELAPILAPVATLLAGLLVVPPK
jgi:ABC-type transport system involved in cytochrome c biogenesis permease component